MSKEKAPWYFLLLLILAGECVFFLPFVLPRIFRPTVLDAFSLDNTQLGLCYSVYGLVAMLAYLFGGPLADKFAPRKLMAVALWTTAIGGLYLLAFPEFETLRLLYGYWGFTTIFLFWAPMIKATRIWGGNTSQGKAFGFLDGGRGLVAGLIGTVGVFIFSLFLTSEIEIASIDDKKAAFKFVILLTCALVAIVGVLVWFFLKMDEDREKEIVLQKISFSQLKDVLKLPAVWLLMVIILCAYVGYKITDVFSLYAQDVMAYDQVQAATIGTILLYLRPVVGVAIGLLADRSNTAIWLFIGFLLSIIGSLLFASGFITESTWALYFISTLIVATGVYAARSLYFAVMESGKIPIVLTGTAVGLISLIGFTPDIFAGPAMGYLLDRSPGVVGHQDVFLMLAFFSFIGGVAAWLYYKKFKE